MVGLLCVSGGAGVSRLAEVLLYIELWGWWRLPARNRVAIHFQGSLFIIAYSSVSQPELVLRGWMAAVKFIYDGGGWKRDFE